MKVLEKFCRLLDLIASFITVGLMIFLTIMIFASVVSRFIFNNPIAWQYETTLLCFAWVIFIGQSITFRLDEHMRLTFVPNAIPESARKYWYLIMDGIVFAFLLVSGIASISIVKNAIPTLYQTIPVSRAWFYAPYPIGCFMSLFHILNTNLKRLKGEAEEAKDIAY